MLIIFDQATPVGECGPFPIFPRPAGANAAILLFVMCRLGVIAFVMWSMCVAGAQVRHWSETPKETIWRTLYTNCDRGWAVDLPAGVVAHGSLPPNSNHGFLISTTNPGTTAEVSSENPRIIDVYDEYDAMELGSARAYLDWELKNIANKEALQVREIMFQGLRAVQARYSVKTRNTVQLIDSLTAYREQQGLVYHLILQTTDQHYQADSALFADVRAGFRLLPIPKGECTNR